MTGWTPTTVNGKAAYAAPVPYDLAREFYADDQWRQRATTENTLVGKRWSYDANGDIDGIVIHAADLPGTFTNVGDMELHMQSSWRDAYIRITGITAPANGERVIRLNPTVLAQALSLTTSENEMLPHFSHNFTIENAKELVDTPGEWYIDRTTDTIYYYPGSEGAVSAAHTYYVPQTERLVSVNGGTPSQLATNIRFRGLTFEHVANTNPTTDNGWLTSQATIYSRGGPREGVFISEAKNIEFTGNTFVRMGGIGIRVDQSVDGLKVVGNTFTDLGDTAVSVGRAGHTTSTAETNRNVTFKDNLVYRVGRTFYGAPGVTFFGTIGTRIDHNHLQSLPYTGISTGWRGSSDLQVTNNTVVDVLRINRDGGGIYHFGTGDTSAGPNIIRGNYIKLAHRDMGGIYLDQRSASFTVTNNVVDDVDVWLFVNSNAKNNTIADNYATTTRKGISRDGVVNVTVEEPTLLTGPYPAGAQAIVAKAGLEPAYRGLLDLLPAGTNAAPTIVSISGTRSISLTDTITLSGVATDDDRPSDYLRTTWTQLSGPTDGSVAFQQPGAATTRAAFNLPGQYVVRFTADDGALATSSAVTINVAAAALPANVALVAGAGEGGGSRVAAYPRAALAASPTSPTADFDFDAYPGFPGGVFVG